MRGLYPVVDVTTLDAASIDVVAFAEALLEVRPALLQLRAKRIASSRLRALAEALALRCAAAGTGFVLNDDAALAQGVGAAYVHLGQDDGSPRATHEAFPKLKLGWSTHTALELEASRHFPLEYVAVGPVYATRTKSDASPVVPWSLVTSARALAGGRPVVAIGGIDALRAQSLSEHVDMVAVVGALVHADMREVQCRARKIQQLFT